MRGLFLDELSYLREEGAAFARANPKLAHLLADRGEDPDVERLLEGFAYLTSRVQGKLFDEREEFNHSLLSLLWPDFLHPFPSVTMMQLTPQMEHLEAKRVVPAGTTILSRQIEAVRCPFRTTTDCPLYPLEIVDVNWHDTTSAKELLRLEFACPSHLCLADIGLDDLRLNFCGQPQIAQMLYLWFGRYLRKATIESAGKRHKIHVKKQIAPIGLTAQEAILPQTVSSFAGNRLLREFFVFPDKFYGYDLLNLGQYFDQNQSNHFALEIEFDTELPEHVRLQPSLIRLYCVPAVNLFAHDGEPLLTAHEKTAYRVTPQGVDKSLVDIFSIDGVTAYPTARSRRKHASSANGARSYTAFQSFWHEKNRDEFDAEQGGEQLYYHVRPRRARGLPGFDYEISFVQQNGRADQKTILPDEEILSIHLSCFNRHLCHELAVGDICYPLAQAADFVSYTNIVRPTMSVYPALDGTLDWQLLANLSLNYKSVLDCHALDALLVMYDPACHSTLNPSTVPLPQRDHGLLELKVENIDRFHRGFYLRGQQSTLTLKESAFQTEGEMYLFATILAQFFHLSSRVNSFHDLKVRGEEHGEVYQWPAKIG